MNLTRDPIFVDAHRSGELGGNEMLIHRAMAYLECNDGLHDALYDAASLYLREMGFLTPLADKYLGEAIRKQIALPSYLLSLIFSPVNNSNSKS